MRRLVIGLAMTVALTGCQADGETGEGGAMEAQESTEMALPDTTAEAVWAYLQRADYRAQWGLWPGKGELYEGTEPHGMLLTTYLNDAAMEALQSGSGPLPAGAIVVKENYMPDSTLAATTVMYKVEGYNPDHNDWFFSKHGPAGEIQAEGRAPMCQQCHSAASRDYLLTAGTGAGM